MNLRDIKYILSAVETGSFAKAAVSCHVSQPSLSIQIKKVEDFLGHKIFIREKTGVRLSTFGESLIPHLETIQDNVSKIDNLARKQKDKPLEAVTLGAIATVAPYIFPHIANFNDIIFEESTTAILVKKLLDDEIDAALLAMPIKVPMLKSMMIYQEPFYLVSSKKNPYMDKMDFDNMVPPDGCHFLALSDEHCMGEQVINLCRLNQATPHKIFKATSLETARNMVSSSNDLTLMPSMAKRDGDGLTYYPLPEKYHRTIGLVYKSSNEKTEQIHALHQKIKKFDFI